MGVYIKGMEMPTSCEKCPFLDYEEGFCFATVVKGKSGWYESKLCPGGIKDGRHADCPLVPVPPHGRLIDADALENEAQMRLLECNKYDNQFQKPYEVMRAIALAPTVIPAEEGE